MNPPALPNPAMPALPAEADAASTLAQTRAALDAALQRVAVLDAALQRQVAETTQLQAQLQEQSLRDPLTGLHNRRHLFETGPGLLERARRQQQSVCAVMIDLDHFKQLNAVYGHQAGDGVLQRFAALLARQGRRSDVLCRYSGEEFVALLDDIDAEGAHRMLARLLEAWLVESTGTGPEPLPPGSFSAGIALFPQHGDSLPMLLQRADGALFAAKGLGRARIEIAVVRGLATLN